MKSEPNLFEQAQRYIPGGVNSPVRAFQHLNQAPIFIDHAQGPYLYDTEQRAYVDYVNSWGPLITGHSDSEVIDAITRQLQKGLSFGAPTELETEMAKCLCRLMPSLEMVRMVNSGTEATMSAIRLARGFTSRNKIIKFEGCYHGHVDALLVKAGSGALTQGQPSSAGVPEAVVAETLTLPFNQIMPLQSIFAAQGHEIAAVIIEPIAGNMSCVPAKKEFLQTLRQLCDQYGSVLIFDEVMSGFRVALGGAQALYNIRADLTCLGKIIGAGLPVGAFGGRAEIMQHLAPLGPVYQAGTLSGNPLAMAAGLALLQKIQAPHFYELINLQAKKLSDGLLEVAKQAQIDLLIHQIGGMLGVFFTHQSQITGYEDVLACDQKRFYQFFEMMLKEGIYFAPSPFETCFVSSAHNESTLTETLNAAHRVFKQLKSLETDASASVKAF